MPAPAPTQPKKSSSEEEDKQQTQPRINNPKLDEQGKPTQRAISNAKQAHTIARNLYDDAVKGRLEQAAIVSNKYNGDTPYNQKKLKDANQGWRNNFTTQFLASIIDRVKPQFLDPVNRADRITFSTLPAEMERSAEKSRFFQERTTKLVRKQPEWPDTLSMLSQEVVTHGGALPGWIDDSFMPRVWRTDEAFLPEGTGQHSSKVQLVVYLQKILIHDFLGLINDKQAAEDAGYNLKGCYAAVNGSDAESERSPVEEADALRENAGNGYSFQNANKTVDVFHVLVREWDGTVHLWSVSFKDGHEIRHREGHFPDMTDAVTVFTLQTGNTKFYGSKGLGRLICNLHMAIERNRCLAADMIYLAGLLIIQGDAKKCQPIVQHPFLVIPAANDVTIAKEQIQFDVDGFLALDKMFVSLAESIAGAFIPPNLDNQGSSNTKIEAAAKAEREMAVRQGVLGRFFQHFAELVQAMQRKIYSADNLKEAWHIYQLKQQMEQKGLRGIVARTFAWLKNVIGDAEVQKQKLAPIPETQIADPDCVEAIVDLLEFGLSIEEIIKLADSPAGNEVQNNGEVQDNKTIDFLVGEVANPYIDQKESTKVRAEIMMGRDRAERVLIKEAEDPNVNNKAIRDQTIEFSEMLQGNPMPVVSGDPHKLHRRALIPMLTPIAQMLQQAPTPEMVTTMELGLGHFAEHLVMDVNTAPEEKAQEEQAGAEMMAVLDNAKKALEQLAAEAAKVGAGPGEMPPGLPPGAQPPVDPALESQNRREDITAAADIEFKAADADLKERAQALKEDEHILARDEFEHKKTMDHATLQRDTELEITKIQQQAQSEANRAAQAAQKQTATA
jgi:hypothetical protein